MSAFDPQGRPLVPPPARPSWDEYFMQFAELATRRSTCVCRQVGAVLVKDRMILATGYNGSPAGCRHPAETGCIRRALGIPSGERHEISRCNHAEMNAIVQAAYQGTAIAGATLYCTHHPCVLCARMLINAGIARICYRDPYADDTLAGQLCRELLDEAGLRPELVAAHAAPPASAAAPTPAPAPTPGTPVPHEVRR